MKKTFKYLSLIIRDWYSFYPKKNIQPERDLDSYVRKIKIETRDEILLDSLFYHCPESSTLILYFHGNSGNIYNNIKSVEELYKQKNNVLLVDYRGFGKSSGQPSEQGIYLDGEACLDYAINKLKFKEENIIVLGRSLGSTVALHIAQSIVLKGVILITPLTSGKEMAKVLKMGFLKRIAGDSFENNEKIKQLNSKLLIIHGENDKVIPFAMGQKLFNLYKNEKTLVKINNANHENLQDVDPILFWGEIKKFIHKKSLLE